MGNKILHKKSDVSGNTPALNVLSAGEIAINTADGFLFFKKNTESGDYVSKFVDIEGQAHVLNISLSSFVPQFGGNTVSEVFGSVLGGYSNDVSGAASTAINGENNDIDSDFSLIGNGENNKISIGADYSFIAAGQNNLVSHSNVFTLGSNLSSHANDFTYVNNLSSVGKIYGDGSELTGIVAGDSEATNLVRSNSANWDSTYTTVQSNSASWGEPSSQVIITSDPIKYSFTSDGSATRYNIGGTANSENASLVEVFVENVRQEPETSYTLSAEKIDFLNAPPLNSKIVVISPNNTASNVNETLTVVQSNSANWDIAYDIATTGGNLNGSLTAIDITSTGKYYGDGSSLTGIVAGDTEATTLVRANSANWGSTYTTVNSNSASWINSKTIAFFTALDNEPPATNFATFDTRNSHPVLDFDTVTQEAAIFRGIIPDGTILLSGCNVITQWAATSATTGTIGWDVAFERIASNGINLGTNSFGTAQTIAATTVPSTSGITLSSFVTFTQAQLPIGLTNGDMYRLRVRRDVANDTASGDAELLGVEVRMV